MLSRGESRSFQGCGSIGLGVAEEGAVGNVPHCGNLGMTGEQTQHGVAVAEEVVVEAGGGGMAGDEEVAGDGVVAGGEEPSEDGEAVPVDGEAVGGVVEEAPCRDSGGEADTAAGGQEA